ncbi:MAG TPA: ATP-dependent metallopeptidase FtsH/Yme1/Tma family protein, partial [Solirubrobacteraceae bacterium]|nr:ATP-dependent metallopeptidase FtsH/Yme1/Tma family protein [Solirubrobacteraceae bacterium]
MTRFFKSAAFPIIIVIILAFFASRLISNSDRAERTDFATFLTQLDDSSKPIKSVTLETKDNSLEVTKPDGKKYEVGYPVDYSDVLVNKLRAAKDAGNIQTFDVRPARSSVILSLLTYVLPFLIFIGFWIFLMNQVQGGGSKVMSFGKSRAKRLSVDSPKITFRDVAGADEA